MDAAPSPPPPETGQPSVLAAWPWSAQLTLAFLLGVAVALLLVQSIGAWHWRGRAGDLERGTVRYRIDLNRADRAELLQLPGVGESMAARIEEHRRRSGGFRTVEELAEVPGVGPATLERLRGWVSVEDPEPGPSPAAASSEKGATQTLAPAYGARKVASLKEPVNVNEATAEEMRRVLPGIGPTLAQRIVAERQKGPFKSVEDLRRVPGIGPKTVERLRPHVVVEGRPLTVTRAD